MANKPLTILIAEDNAADVFLVRTALEEEGLSFHLEVCSDGEAVVYFLERLHADGPSPCPDLILLDLNLPRYSGEELLSRVRESPRCAGVPVIVLTSSDSPKDRERATQFGVAHYFRKPSDLDEFLRLGPVVREVLAAR